MRRFPFGALSSSDSLAYGRMMWPCAEREAPHGNSLPGAGACSIEVGAPQRWDEDVQGTMPAQCLEILYRQQSDREKHVGIDIQQA